MSKSMSTAMTFADPRLARLDGFRVEIDHERERADVILDRPPFNIIEMPQRDQLRLVFEAIDEDPRVRIIVLRAAGEHFSSGGNIRGFLEASPEHVSKLAWDIAAPARCAKPVIAANRGYCFGVGFEISLACDFRIASETCRLRHCAHEPPRDTCTLVISEFSKIHVELTIIDVPKARAARPDVPIIMITAYGDAETKRRALEGGAEALLTKPIDFVMLRSEIDTRVERAA
jgi:Enoyl-CoA hydratase/isomerase